MGIKYRLGLDVGANSLGWSVLKLDTDDKPYKIENAGARIFSDGREPKGHSTLKAVRRTARSARRNRDRFKQRQTYLIKELEKAKLFPPESDTATRHAIQKLDPLELRANALHEKLDPYHIGRALFHINQRRGFKSNRKDTSEEARSGKVSKSVMALFKKMGLVQQSSILDEPEKLSEEQNKWIRQEEAKQKKEAITKLKDLDITFGSFLWERRKQHPPQATRAHPNVDGKLYDLYPTRDLLEDEFDKICAKQQKYHPKLLSAEVVKHLRKIIFYQRPLKPQERGKCAYLYKAGELRAFRAMPSFQRYRIYQEVNNLEWAGPRQPYRLRDYPEARDAVVTLLEKPTTKKGNVTFTKIKNVLKDLGVAEGEFKLNYETLKRKKTKRKKTKSKKNEKQKKDSSGLDGNLTSNIMQKEDCIGAQWHDWPIEKQDSFIGLILNDKLSDVEVRDKLVKEYKLSEEIATVCLEEHLPEGTAHLSLKAAKLLTEKMKNEYCLQSEAVERVSEEHSDFVSPFIRSTEEGKLLERLPYYGEFFKDGKHIIPGTLDEKDEHDNLRFYGSVTNPTVHIALNQIRNVINELIKRYGHPASIAIELGRELPVGEEGRKEIEKEQKKNQTNNEEIDAKLKELGQLINRDNRIRFRLWEELDEEDPAGRKCPFTGKTIGIHDIFSDEFEVEHLIPFSRSLDDSFSNKVLCSRQANGDKGQQTPYEAFGDSLGGYNWNEIFERSKSLPDSKQWRFEKDAMKKWQRNESDFLARHLNDTRYIGRLTKDYLKAICPYNEIYVVTGRLTALLRGHWGLNSILNEIRADEELKRLGQEANKDNRVRYWLWEELNEDPNGRECPFTGKTIVKDDIFSDEFEIGYLIPDNTSKDNSFSNKVLCSVQANQDKGQQTPYEAFGHSPDDYNWNNILQRSERLPENKQWRFLEDAMEKWQSKKFGSSNYNKAKKSRDDHRHHAIDAIVIGMTTRSILQKVATAANQSEELDLPYLFNKKENSKSAIDPWLGFRADVKNIIDNIIVSHRKRDKQLGRDSTSGQLHDSTAYGIVTKHDNEKSTVVVRRPIKELSENRKKLGSIRDKHLKEQFLDAFDGNGKEGVMVLAEQKNIRGLRCIQDLSIIPIKDKEGREYKAFKGGSNWGYEIYEYPKGHKKAGEWEGFVISTHDANQKNFQPGVTHRPHPTAKLVMRLHINDCIEIIGKDGIPQIMRLQKISESLSFVPPNEANVAERENNKELKFFHKTGSSLLGVNARKIHISPTGLKNYDGNCT